MSDKLTTKEIILKAKDGEIRFDLAEINNFKISEMLNDLISDDSEELEINQLSVNQLIKFKDFCQIVNYSNEAFDSKKLNKKELFEKFPKIKYFYEELNSFKLINEYYIISDYLRIKLLDSIILLRVSELIDEHYKNLSLSNEEVNALRLKYLENCTVDELGMDEIEQIIKN